MVGGWAFGEVKSYELRVKGYELRVMGLVVSRQ